MKHRIKNIANRTIPIDGTKLKPKPEQIVKAEITPRIKYLINNKFFEDLGEIEEVKKKEEEEEEKINKIPIGTESDIPEKPIEPEIKFNRFKKRKKTKKEMI